MNRGYSVDEVCGEVLSGNDPIAQWGSSGTRIHGHAVPSPLMTCQLPIARFHEPVVQTGEGSV